MTVLSLGLQEWAELGCLPLQLFEELDDVCTAVPLDRCRDTRRSVITGGEEDIMVGGESGMPVPMPAGPRTMDRGDYAEVVAVAVRAFWCVPLVDFFSRDLLHEYRLLPAVFEV
ncbi:MAG TPA: hypothetical protein VMV06_03745 [Acidimicrobiales bacterium]|nr:hypothetical protein [Acidimicrobiales bacterium]